MALLARWMTHNVGSAGDSGSSWSFSDFCRWPLTVTYSAPLFSTWPSSCSTSWNLPAWSRDWNFYLIIRFGSIGSTDEQTLLGYVGSSIEDAMKKCFSTYWEGFVRVETCLVLPACLTSLWSYRKRQPRLAGVSINHFILFQTGLQRSDIMRVYVNMKMNQIPVTVSEC